MLHIFGSIVLRYIFCNYRQENQLSLTNRATRLEVSQRQKHGTIPYLRYVFLLVFYSNLVPKMNRF